ncbi:MAG: RNA polymerase sigma factor [Planctomycetota bacterium]|nr:RNA polymerase sigma factor [Planctomycetota bacterium]
MTFPRPENPPQQPARSFEARLAGSRVELVEYARRLVPPGKGLAGAHRDYEDLVQDALERALARKSSFEGTRPMLPWLKRILLRLFLDHRTRLLASPEGPRPESLVESDGPAKPASEETLDPGQQVLEWLGRLDEPERGILRRFPLGGETVEGIANSLLLPVGTVKSHLHRARRRLQALAKNKPSGGRS